jgi:hypothetical protein
VDNKSHHSGFSAFNMNMDNKSDAQNQSGVDWNDFDNLRKTSRNIGN